MLQNVLFLFGGNYLNYDWSQILTDFVYACGFFFHILYHQTIKGQIRFLKCEDVTDFVDENRE